MKLKGLAKQVNIVVPAPNGTTLYHMENVVENVEVEIKDHRVEIRKVIILKDEKPMITHTNYPADRVTIYWEL